MDSSEFRRAGHDAIDKIADYYDGIHRTGVQANVEPGFLRQLLPPAAPENGESWASISEDIESIIKPGLSHWSHPGFMAYFPASSTFEGILGELYSAAFNGPAFDWICSPSVTELENVVMDWLVKLLGLPTDFCSGSGCQGGGVIMGSTTESLVATMVAARKRFILAATMKSRSLRLRLDERHMMQRLVVLGSSETHPATSKAAAIIGVQYRSVGCSPKSGIAMTEAHLRMLIEECLAEGLLPFYVTATFGTTNSCAVDDFRGFVNVANDYPELWIHADAAFAGAALACEEYRDLLAGARSLDSFSVNLGKWLLTNLDSTAVMVRQQMHLTDALQNTCSILSNKHSDSGQVIDYRNLQLSMGRRFRALKVWFVLRSWGCNGIRAHIRRHIGMAMTFTSLLESRPDLFNIVAKPQFAINVFEISKQAADKAGLSVSQAVLRVVDAVNATNEIWLTKTSIDGSPALRIVSANPKANESSLARAFELLVGATEALFVKENKKATDTIEQVIEETARSPNSPK